MKTILTIIFSLACIIGAAQEKIIYVVFTDCDQDNPGISNLPPSNDYNSNKFRCPIHFFRPRNPKVNFYRTYYYSNPVDSPDNPIIYKPVRFLETVDYLDWDKETLEMSYKQLVSLINEINTHDTIYFIDRAEIKDDMMTLYPVKEAKSLF